MDEQDKKAISRMRELGYHKESVDHWESLADKLFDFPTVRQVEEYAKNHPEDIKTKEGCLEFFIYATS